MNKNITKGNESKDLKVDIKRRSNYWTNSRKQLTNNTNFNKENCKSLATKFDRKINYNKNSNDITVNKDEKTKHKNIKANFKKNKTPLKPGNLNTEQHLNNEVGFSYMKNTMNLDELSAFNIAVEDDIVSEHKTVHTNKNLEQLLEVLDTEPESCRKTDANYYSCQNFVRRSRYEIISEEERGMIAKFNAQLPM